MSESAVAGGGGGPDFSLPDEILAVIPTDPYDQLDLARKITSMAIASRVSKLEAEVSGLRQKLVEKDRLVYELEGRVAYLEKAFQEADSGLRNVLDENVKLTQERDSLAMTAKKLGRDFAKLEAFKKQLMQSLNDGNPSQTVSTDVGTVPRVYPDRDETSNGYSANFSYSGSIDTGNSKDGAGLSKAGQRLSSTPTGTPRILSGSASPKIMSGAASPITSHYDVRVSLPSWCSSQQSSGANSPLSLPPSEFFRQARSRLSYQQFSAFLANIKELNNQKQTREETLKNAEEIFGTENKDLYLSFQGLLSHRQKNEH
ncbi:PREDICTED: uncharacterized protein At4g15545 [Tarenaya hassleriana]|uniref:uncharacterized protein At4g15545 n=1 Tax=Tarenaya hassleriana TaxID=28532 RepID=UPI00053C5762|nr:PREDICTED: uncharacterized protein At4g15545 [Tarenaya hassleriana]